MLAFKGYWDYWDFPSERFLWTNRNQTKYQLILSVHFFRPETTKLRSKKFRVGRYPRYSQISWMQDLSCSDKNIKKNPLPFTFSSSCMRSSSCLAAFLSSASSFHFPAMRRVFSLAMASLNFCLISASFFCLREKQICCRCYAKTTIWWNVYRLKIISSHYL